MGHLVVKGLIYNTWTVSDKFFKDFQNTHCFLTKMLMVQRFFFQRQSLKNHFHLVFVKASVGLIRCLLFADDNIPEPFYGTKFVAVKIHQQFAQAIMGRSEVDFNLGFLSWFNACRNAEKYF